MGCCASLMSQKYRVPGRLPVMHSVGTQYPPPDMLTFQPAESEYQRTKRLQQEGIERQAAAVAQKRAELEDAHGKAVDDPRWVQATGLSHVLARGGARSAAVVAAQHCMLGAPGDNGQQILPAVQVGGNRSDAAGRRAVHGRGRLPRQSAAEDPAGRGALSVQCITPPP